MLPIHVTFLFSLLRRTGAAVPGAIRQRGVRWFSRLICGALFGRACQTPFQAGEVRRMLIVRNDKIGDMVVSTPLFRALKQRYPDMLLDIVASSANRQVIEANPHINDVIVWDKLGVANDMALIRTLRRRRYDAVFLTHCVFSLPFLLRLKLLGAKYLFGFNDARYGTSTAELGMFERTVDCVRSAPILDSYFAALAPFGLSGAARAYELFGVDAHAGNVGAFLAPLKARHTGLICFNYQGSHSTRTLHDEDSVLLCRSIAQRYPGHALLVIHPPGGRGHAQALVGRIDRPNVLLCCETANVLELAALVRMCDLVLSPDTAVVHLASAYNKPVLGFYINTDNYRWFYPASDHYKVQLAAGQQIGRIDVGAAMADVRALLPA
jgi:ADP-heptose:LPS heptosyltransferase